MAEERTLGLARAPQRVGEDESKEDLQRRMELARDSISNTVIEIKESVANQVQAVKDTLDWREQFKKRPVAWSASALGVGLVAGYGIAGAMKGDSRGSEYYRSEYRFPPQVSAGSMSSKTAVNDPNGTDEGPGLVERFKETAAYGSLSKEVASLGSKVVEDLSSTAHLVLVPFLLSKLKEMVGLDKLEKTTAGGATRTATPRTDWSEPEVKGRTESTLGHS